MRGASDGKYCGSCYMRVDLESCYTCMSPTCILKQKVWLFNSFFFVNRAFTYLTESQTMVVLSFNHDNFMQIVAIIYGSLYFWLSSLAVSSVHQVYNTKRFDSFNSCMVILEQDPSFHLLK
jgi:hypothetical protein